MARRIVNRKDKRAEVEAFERRKEDEDRDEDEEEDEDDDEEGDEDEDEEEGDEDEEDLGDEDDDEEAPKKKKKKAPVVKPKAKPRARAVKTTRMRVVWVVFSNSHQEVATYDYPKKDEAEAHAARLTADKRSTHFVQPVKKPIEEKKEK